MTIWQGWVAALGGLLGVSNIYYPSAWLGWIGGLAAIIFGIWAVYAE